MKLFFAFFILVSIVCKSSRVFGQFNLGIHGGINISSLAPPLANSTSGSMFYTYNYSKSLTGYYAGLFTELKLNKYLGLLMDCSYTQDGYQTYSQTFGTGFTASIYHIDNTRIHFVEPQAIVEYGLPLGTGKMSLGAGFNVTIPVSGQEKMQYNFTPSLGTKIDTTVYNNNISRKISVGIVGMLRYEFNFGLFFEVLYKYQIKAQPYYNLGQSVSSAALNLNVFEIGTGFTFQYRKRE